MIGFQHYTKSIAVLPFVNMSANDENEYFSDGMTEEIINALSKIQHLKVTSRTSSFYFKNKDLPLPEIGKSLNVSTILEGSVRLSGTKMRITAQLIDVKEDIHFWSETFDRSVEDVFAVQDEISLLIADRLREHLGHLEIADQLVLAQNIPVEIYKQYLKSRHHILKMTKPEIEYGLEILLNIIDTHPDFALAHLGVHLAYTLQGTIGFLPAEEAFVEGQQYLDKAIELAADLPECQLHLSYISLLQHWDLSTTYHHLQKAFECRPTVEYYQSMASTLVAEGKCSAAMTYIQVAMQLDPFSAISHHLTGFIHYVEEQYDAAIRHFEQAVSLNPQFMASTIYWGQALLLQGKGEQALDYFQQLPSDHSADVMRLGGITMSHCFMGNKKEAEIGLVELVSSIQSDLEGRAIQLLMYCHAIIGNKKEAMSYLRQGIAQRLPMMIYMPVEPLLKSLRSEPEFTSLMSQIFGTRTSSLPASAQRRYKKSLLDPSSLENYQRKLTQLMREQSPYLDPQLTLRSLAQMMQLPPNHLSQLLNEGFDKNFSEFVNSYRLEAFKQRAANPAHHHLTILALAYESGFNSKTVFNTFFKKMMGTTPSAYWREMTQ